MVASSAGCSPFLDDFADQLIVAIAARQSATHRLNLPRAANARCFRIPDMFGGIFTLGLVGFIINFAFVKIEQHFLRWRGTSVET